MYILLMLKVKSEKLKVGFTLIELLVVISIIGILTTLIAANLNSARSRARDAARKSDVRNIATALRLYFNDSPIYNNGTSTFPRSDASGNIRGCDVGGASACTYGSPWTAGNPAVTYMSKLPQDPLGNQNYFYKWNPLGSGSDTYSLTACLENKSDPNGVSIQSVPAPTVAGFGCASGWVFQTTP